MTWMLRNVVEAGTGAAAQLPNRPVAGKTGTSDEARDLWFIGYIPQVVTGVWLGNDNNRPTYGSSGSAAYTWHEFMEKAIEGMPIEKFPERPKLEGRKGSIKAKPIKAKQILNRSLTPNEESAQETGSSSRRRRRSQRLEETTPTDSPRRRRRYRSQESGSSGSEESPRTRRRRPVVESDTSQPSRRSRRSSSTVDNSSGSASSAPTPSWRERLRPNSSSSN